MVKIALFWICAAIAAAVFGVMIHSIATFRMLPGAKAAAAFERKTGMEVLWAFIPILIVIAMAVPALEWVVN